MHFSNTTKSTNQHISTLFSIPVWFFRNTSWSSYLGFIRCDSFWRIDSCRWSYGFSRIGSLPGATLSGNLLMGGMILSLLNFSVNFSLIGIKSLRFLIMTFTFSFKTSCDRGRLFCFMTMPFLPQRFCSSVRILTVFHCEIFGKEWVVLWGLGVSVTNEFCESKGLTEGRFVRSWQLKHFWAG